MRLVSDRWEVIREYVAGKDVLDVGTAELYGSEKKHGHDKFLFAQISPIAKSLLGLDINKEEVERLRAIGYKNLLIGDAETINLEQDFDVIVAGDIIEHLSNPGLFLDNMRGHLREDGVLILTTPNRFDFYAFMKAFITGQQPNYSKPIAAHVAHYDINTLTALANRQRFKLEVYYYYTTGQFPTLKARLLLKPIIDARPNFALGLIAVLRKDLG